MQQEITSGSDFFFVDIFSNSNSKDKNSTVSFVNTLAHPLHLNTEDNWVVGLHKIICNNKFYVRASDDKLYYSQEQVEKASQLSQIYIRCKQIQQSFDGRQLLSCHSRTPYDKETNRIHSFEPKNILFFPLATSVINEIEIDLLNPNLEPLFLRPGQATSVTLKFQKAKMRESLVPIFVSSKGKFSLEGNTPTNFTCEIPAMFSNNTQYKWQIGLNSITYISDFRLFPRRWTSNSYFFIAEKTPFSNVSGLVSDIELREDDLMYGESGEEAYNKYRTSIPQTDIDQWSTEKEVRAYLHNFLLESIRDYQGLRNTYVAFKNLYNKAEEEADPNYVYKGPVRMSIVAPCVFSCPSWIMELLGFRGYKTVRNGHTAIFDVKRPVSITARTEVDVYALAPHSISIYADFIEQKLMANIQTSVLKTIPVKHRFGKKRPSETYESTNIEYYNLATRDLTRMSFRLIDASGHEVEFANTTQNVTLSLILRTII